MGNQIIIALDGMRGAVVRAVQGFIKAIQDVVHDVIISVIVNLPNYEALAARIRAGMALLDAAGSTGSKGGKSTSSGGGGGGGGCFIAGTMITLADNTKLPIEMVKVGDLVLSFDTDTWTSVVAVVEKIYHHTDKPNDHFFIIDGLGVTEEHPIYANSEWIPAGQLAIHDVVVEESGRTRKIENITKINECVVVYNLHTSHKTHNYFANGILVHNKAVGFAGGGITDGPSSGHYELLHGREAVIPLDRGNIPVKLEGGSGSGSGGGDNYNIYISFPQGFFFGDQQDFYETLNPLMQRAIREAKGTG